METYSYAFFRKMLDIIRQNKNEPIGCVMRFELDRSDLEKAINALLDKDIKDFRIADGKLIVRVGW